MELLAADDSAKQQEATVAERKSALEKYRREFLDVAAQIEAGRLTSRTALRDALRPTHAVLQTIMDDAESLGKFIVLDVLHVDAQLAVLL